jgi:hypothetical protein
MRIQIFLVINFISLLLYSQEKSIYFNSNINFETNAINGSFINELLFNGYINDQVKDNVLSINKDRHIVNFTFNNSIKYTEPLNNGFSLNLSISDVNNLNTTFNNDLLRLILKGNYESQNELLEFNQTRVRANRYQQLKLFLDYKRDDSSIGLGLSYIQGNHHLTLTSNRGSLFTSYLGESLDLDYDINAYITDTSSFSPFNNNGNGIAIDLAGSISMFNRKFNIYLMNLGFILWNNKSSNIYVDSSFTFNGIEIDNLFEFNDSILEASNIIDDYDNLVNENKRFKSYLSSDIGVRISKKVKNDKFGMITYGVNTKWQPYLDDKKLSFKKIRQGFVESNYKPFYYVETEIITKKYSLLPKIAYGGYTNNLNLNLGVKFKRKISVILGTQHLEYLFTKKNSRGFGLYIKLFKNI